MHHGTSEIFYCKNLRLSASFERKVTPTKCTSALKVQEEFLSPFSSSCSHRFSAELLWYEVKRELKNLEVLNLWFVLASFLHSFLAWASWCLFWEEFFSRMHCVQPWRDSVSPWFRSRVMQRNCGKESKREVSSRSLAEPKRWRSWRNNLQLRVSKVSSTGLINCFIPL